MTCFSNAKISITGDLGSGKSSVCKIIRERYGFDIYSTGKIQREIAERHNMTTLELNRYSETHPEIDMEIDSALTAVGKTDGNLLLDSRMAWHFVPHSFKVFLKVDIDISADRVMNNHRGRVEQYGSHDEAGKQIMLRKSSENMRYLIKYGVDCSNMANFDLVIDTSLCNVDTIAEAIIQNMEKWDRGEPYQKLWLSTRFIFPTIYFDSWSTENLAAKNDNICNIVESGGMFFIYEGHKTVSKAVLNGIELIPACLAGKDNEILSEKMSAADFVKQNYTYDKAMTWEIRHNFKFPKYPAV